MNPAVTAIGRLNIEGNIVPNAFFSVIVSPRTGKPHLLAVMTMADILYWYRPREIRDEVTGETLEWRQKFKADLLQKSYNGYAALYGVSRGQVKEAIDLLRQLKLIRVEFRNIITPEGQTLANVMFVEPVVATIERVLEGVVRKNTTPSPEKTGDVYKDYPRDYILILTPSGRGGGRLEKHPTTSPLQRPPPCAACRGEKTLQNQ